MAEIPEMHIAQEHKLGRFTHSFYANGTYLLKGECDHEEKSSRRTRCKVKTSSNQVMHCIGRNRSNAKPRRVFHLSFFGYMALVSGACVDSHIPMLKLRYAFFQYKIHFL